MQIGHVCMSEQVKVFVAHGVNHNERTPVGVLHGTLLFCWLMVETFRLSDHKQCAKFSDLCHGVLVL